MSILASFTPSLHPNPVPSIPDADACRALALAHTLAYRQWRRDGHRLDLTEYVDAALDALVGCLTRYRPGDVPLSAYAARRMWGAVRDAREHYAAWHLVRPLHATDRPHAWALCPPPQDLANAISLQQWVRTLPHAVQQYALAVLAGWTQRGPATRVGIAEGRLSQVVKQWRQGWVAGGHGHAGTGRARV